MPRPHVPALALCSAFVALHLLLPSSFLSEDALFNALTWMRASWREALFWRPPHPLWSPVGAALFHGLEALGYAGGALELLQKVNLLVAGAALYAFYLLLLELRCTRPAALVATAWLAVSFGFWVYSADAKMYAWASLFLFATLRWGLRLARSPGSGWRSWVGFGAFSALVPLWHVTAAFFLPAVGAALLLAPRPLRDRLAALSVSGLAFTGCLAAGYWLCFSQIAEPGGSSWFEWVLGPATQQAPWIDDMYGGTLARKWTMFGRRFLASLAVTGADWPGSLWYYPTRPGPVVGLLMRLGGLYSAGFLAAVLAGLAAARRPLAGPWRHEAGFCLAWAASGVLGFALLAPDNNYVYILWAPFLALLALVLSMGPARAIVAGWLAVLLLLAVNATLRFVPSTELERNPHLTKVASLRSIVGPEDLAVCLIEQEYYEYYLGCETVGLFGYFQRLWPSPSEASYRSLAEQVDRALAQGRDVYLDDDLYQGSWHANPLPATCGLDHGEFLRFVQARYRVVPVRDRRPYLAYRITPRGAGAGTGSSGATPPVPP